MPFTAEKPSITRSQASAGCLNVLRPAAAGVGHNQFIRYERSMQAIFSR
jgi:hypothetical protein